MKYERREPEPWKGAIVVGVLYEFTDDSKREDYGVLLCTYDSLVCLKDPKHTWDPDIRDSFSVRPVAPGTSVTLTQE